MKKVRSFSRRILKNQSGQGMVEYILLLVVVVAIVVLFKDKIKTAVSDKMDTLKSDIGSFNGN